MIKNKTYWLLTSEFPPQYGGGIATYCEHTSKMLHNEGFSVTVFYPDFSQESWKIINSETCREIKFNPNYFGTNSFLGYEANLSYGFAQILKVFLTNEGLPSFVESQEYNAIAYYTLQFKKLRYPLFKDLSIFLTLHAPSFLYWEFNKFPVYKLPYYWIGEMEKECILQADFCISPSKYLIQEIQKRFDISNCKIHILPNPFENFVSEIEENNSDDLIFFGKLTPQKGVENLIQFFRELLNKDFKGNLILIGGGNHYYHPEEMDMIDFLHKTNKDLIDSQKLIFKGSIAPNELPKILKKSLAVIVPSIVENFPYTVLETMRMGLIVLASKQGGQSEIIKDGVDGFLFDYDENGSFAAKVEEIQLLDKNKRNGIKKAAFEKVKSSFNYKSIVAQKQIILKNEINSKSNNGEFVFRSYSKKLALDNSPNLLSIVIPYYNMGNYVLETIESLERSTFPIYEIIIVNDGSTDKYSLEVLSKINSENETIKIFHKKNEGLAIARNFGAEKASGKFLAFLDPDDTIENSYYQKAIDVLESHENIFFVGCWAKYFGENTGYWPAFNPNPPYLLFHNLINSSALVYKKSAFIQSGKNDPKLIYGMEDYESVINLVKNGFNGVVLPEALWNYRVRKNSMARAFTDNKQLYLYNIISNKHKEYFSIFASELSNLLNANGPGYKIDNPTFFHHNNQIINSRFFNLVIQSAKANPILRRLILKMKKIIKYNG